MPPRVLRRVAAVLVAALTGALLVAGPARAATTDSLAATLTPSKGTITVGLAGAQYATTPDFVRISASRNRCTSANPCWAAPDATVYVSTDFTGTYRLTGLHANAQYQVQLYADGGGTFTGIVTTPVDVDQAPTDPPLAVVSADGLHAIVTVQPETDPEAMGDTTPLAKLRYNVYAYANGTRLKRVMSNVAGGTTRTIAGLPRNTAITFTETDVNAVGESPETVTPGGVLLAPTAPGAFGGTWQSTAAGVATIAWGVPQAGAGALKRYVVTIASPVKTVMTKTVAATVNRLGGLRLARHGTYTASVTAVNTYGASTTISGTLITP